MTVHWRVNGQDGLALASGTFRCDFVAQVSQRLVEALDRAPDDATRWASISVEIER